MIYVIGNSRSKSILPLTLGKGRKAIYGCKLFFFSSFGRMNN